MGILKRLKQGVEAPTELAANVGGTDSGDPHVTNPTPMDELARQWDSMGPVRGVVVAARHAMAAGDRSSRVGASVRVRARLRDGGLGPEQRVKISAPWFVIALLERGLEIPVLVDRATGAVTDIDVPRLTEELEPHKKAAKQREGGWGIDLSAITQGPAALRDVVRPSTPTPVGGAPVPADDDTRPAPVNGVTWDQLVQASAYCAVHSKGGWAEAAQHVGLDPQVFSAAHGQWTTKLAQGGLYPRYAADVDAATPALRGS